MVAKCSQESNPSSLTWVYHVAKPPCLSFLHSIQPLSQPWSVLQRWIKLPFLGIWFFPGSICILRIFTRALSLGQRRVALLLLLEVSSPSSAPLNFLLILAGTWGQSVRVPSPALGRAGPPESLFDLLWLLTQGGLWRVRRHSWRSGLTTVCQERDPVFGME